MAKTKTKSKPKTKLLHSMTLEWWQISIFKCATVAFGILLGVYFKDFLMNYLMLWWAITAIAGIYIASIYFKK